MKHLFNSFENKQELYKYLPPFKDLNRIDKTFFINIMNTIEEDYVNKKVFKAL